MPAGTAQPDAQRQVTVVAAVAILAIAFALNWFFNQWYYGSGHPFLSINYLYQDEKKEARVIIKQTQDGERIFRLPIAVDVYQGASKKRYTVWSEHRSDTFYFPYATRPELINVDAEKILLAVWRSPNIDKV